MNPSNPSPSDQTKAAKPPRASKSVKAVKPAKPAKPAKSAKSAKSAKPARTAKPVKAAKPASPKAAVASGGRAAAKPPAPKPAPAAKPERVKLVRDSFTMPKSDVDLIAALKQRCLKLGHEAKKSEVLRAGLHALAALQDEALVAAVSSVPRLKTGRPGQKKGK